MNTSGGWCWSQLFARWVLGLIFLMAGWWKTFQLTPIGHVERFFLDSFADTWIPTALLWAIGLAIPVLELLAGLLLCLGWRRRQACVVLGAILVVVTYGQLLIEPLFSIQGHIFPRLALLLFLLCAPAEHDAWSVDVWLAGRADRKD